MLALTCRRAGARMAATQAGVILGTILAAQRAYAETGAFPELLSIYHLLGDPALKIN